jgi:hypothetical protein
VRKASTPIRAEAIGALPEAVHFLHAPAHELHIACTESTRSHACRRGTHLAACTLWFSICAPRRRCVGCSARERKNTIGALPRVRRRLEAPSHQQAAPQERNTTGEFS